MDMCTDRQHLSTKSDTVADIPRHPQASFNPPGLTVAVKKDRAVENLLNNGSQFVVNILAEGDHKRLMKQLLKPFKPGEDRFEGLDIQVGPFPACRR